MWVVERFSSFLNKACLPSAAWVLVCATAVSVPWLTSCGPADQGEGKRTQSPSESLSTGQKASRRRANRSATRSATPSENAGGANASTADPASHPATKPQADRPEGFTPAFDSKKPDSEKERTAVPDPSDSRIEAPPPIDEDRVAAAGIRQLEGKHVTIFTDLPSAPGVDELPRIFDLAIKPWCEYFGVGADRVEDWKARAYLMDRRELFEQTGLLPEDLPRFGHGYSQQGQLWLFDQPSNYYRRHLLLHEGTHLFMQTYLRGMGPPWYSEGMAELFGTHRWQDGELRLRYFPQNRDEVPYWGRIKIVKTEYAAERWLSIDQITEFGPTAHLDVEPYGWCWAIAAFLDGHPQFSERFRHLTRHVDDSPRQLTQRFHDLFRSDARQLMEQWRMFVANLEYGYDIQREAVCYEPAAFDRDATSGVEIQADRGWQSTGLVVSPGTTYVLEASGRYQLDEEPKIWWCEPGGVTIRYHDGYPLGMLLAGVSDQTKPLSGMTPLADPQPIGLRRELQFDRPGTLFLRINDSPADLENNRGQARVELRKTAR